MSSILKDGYSVLPGENLYEILESNKDSPSEPIIIGPGLQRESTENVVAYKTGQLMHRPTNRFYVNSNQRYYLPCEKDNVIGIVVAKTSMFCRVDIGSGELATLSLLAFPNATKRNKGIVEVSYLFLVKFNMSTIFLC